MKKKSEIKSSEGRNLCRGMSITVTFKSHVPAPKEKPIEKKKE